MAIKFSAKDQPVVPAPATKKAKPAPAPKAGAATEPATDLFKAPADAPKAKAGKKK